MNDLNLYLVKMFFLLFFLKITKLSLFFQFMFEVNKGTCIYSYYCIVVYWHFLSYLEAHRLSSKRFSLWGQRPVFQGFRCSQRISRYGKVKVIIYSLISNLGILWIFSDNNFNAAEFKKANKRLISMVLRLIKKFLQIIWFENKSA